MAASTQAVVIDLNEFRRRREEQRSASRAAALGVAPLPVIWDLVWVMLPVPMWCWVPRG